MKKNTEERETVVGKESDMTDETMFDILSKKIICMFYSNSLFTHLAITDYEGQIFGQGDKVLMVDHTELLIEHSIVIDEPRDPAIFQSGDCFLINLVTTRIAEQLKGKVEAHILAVDHQRAMTHDDVVSGGKIPPPHVHGRLYFVCHVVPAGGFKPIGYGMKFVYGFKIG